MKAWRKGMSDKETADLAYWERNMLALRYADGWYYDDVPARCISCEKAPGLAETYDCVCGLQTARYSGWRRVLSLDGGRLTFHIPDDFDVGDLQKIEKNWDGHSTEEKWRYVACLRGIEFKGGRK